MSRRYEGPSSGARITSYNLRGPSYVKILLPDKVTGSVIGRGGAVLADFEHQSNTQIKVSPPKVFFPSTNERMVMSSGDTDGLIALLPLILTKMKEHGCDPGHVILRMTVPNSSIASVVGKGGESIRGIQSRSGAQLNLGERIEGLPETILEIKGAENQVIRAAEEVIVLIQSDSRWKEIACEYYGVDFFKSGMPREERDDQQRYDQRYEPRYDPRAHSREEPRYESREPRYEEPRRTDPTASPDLLSYPLTIEFVVPQIAVNNILKDSENIFAQTGADVAIVNNSQDDVSVAISGPLCGVQAAHLLVIKHITDVI